MKILNEGFVKLIETWGKGEAGENEAGIIEAARQSTQGSFRGWEKDEKLLRHLFENQHNTPFEFCGMTIEVKAPIFVFREWHRHRTQSYNEMSARYAPLPNDNYMPTVERLLVVDTKNKQADSVGDLVLTDEAASDWLEDLEDFYRRAQAMYETGLVLGVPKEIARIVLPVGRYSQMRASANLRNWLQFTTLRSDKNAQKEIRLYSEAIETILSEEFPRTYGLWKNWFDSRKK